MAQTHSGYDVYVGDELLYKDAMIIDRGERLSVRTRVNGSMGERLGLINVQKITADSRGKRFTWQGDDPEGASLRVTAHLRDDGCIPCRGGR